MVSSSVPNMMPNTMNNLGTFSWPPSHGIGDPYDKPKQTDMRLRGVRNFSAGPVPKHEIHKDYKRLYEVRRAPGHPVTPGPPPRSPARAHAAMARDRATAPRAHARAQGEKWMSDFERSRKHSLEEKKKNLTDHGFKYSSPNKKSSGLGNYYGTIGAKFHHAGEFDGGKTDGPPDPVDHESRQMMTMPSKKGRFNTPGILFGAPQPKGVPHKLGKEFEYYSEPYNLARKLEMDARAKSKALRQPQPFKGMSHSLDYFDQTRTVAASTVYAPVDMPAKKEKPEVKVHVEKPWYPAKAKGAADGSLNKFPEHLPDPEQERWQAELDRKRAEAANLANPWKPGAGIKSTRTRSILFHHPGAARARAQPRRRRARPRARVIHPPFLTRAPSALPRAPSPRAGMSTLS